ARFHHRRQPLHRARHRPIRNVLHPGGRALSSKLTRWGDCLGHGILRQEYEPRKRTSLVRDRRLNRRLTTQTSWDYTSPPHGAPVRDMRGNGSVLTYIPAFRRIESLYLTICAVIIYDHKSRYQVPGDYTRTPACFARNKASHTSPRACCLSASPRRPAKSCSQKS